MYLDDYLSKYCEEQKISSIIMSLSKAALKISDTIKSMQIKDNTFKDVKKVNVDGDIQKPLDILSDEILIDFLKTSPVSGYASEEQDGFIDFKNDQNFIVFADPLDGSSNIDVNVSIGTIFSIMSKNNLTLEKAFFQKGIFQKASGFFVYGPRTMFVLTLGNGVLLFQLNNKDEFILLDKSIKIPPNTNELSINFSNYTIWPNSIKRYIDKCIGVDKTMSNKNYNMRWIGSLVADCLRILIRGGIFMYPEDARKGYENGRLRLVYEANPISFIIEQAGGIAIDGNNRILSLHPKKLHERVPLIFGSSNEIKTFLKLVN